MFPTEDFPIPSESTEQQHLFQWARMMSGAHPELALMYKITNEGRRSRVNGARMVAEGMKKGVPDICLPVARGGHHGLYIELKRERNSRVTKEQLEWIEALMDQGYAAAVCRGCDEAIRLITDYLAGR
ncbi:MAG: VRR-NUC domain-containing protein [Clostridia bacterium]|nr:VRR-NUC domain-containing protein [Clostridia bacterium]